MINTIKEFAIEHPKSVIVNYDIAGTFDDDSGRTYRTSKKTLEYFRKEKGRYLKYVSYGNSENGLSNIKELVITGK